MEDDGVCGAGIIQKVIFGTGGCACGCLKVIIKIYVLLVKKNPKTCQHGNMETEYKDCRLEERCKVGGNKVIRQQNTD